MFKGTRNHRLIMKLEFPTMHIYTLLPYKAFKFPDILIRDLGVIVSTLLFNTCLVLIQFVKNQVNKKSWNWNFPIICKSTLSPKHSI